MNILIAPFVNAIFGFYYLTGNLGIAIILVTILIRLLVLPLVFPSLKSAAKMRELQPKLNKLKEKYGSDQKSLAAAQMELYKQEKINPLSGCLPTILQIFILMVFFSAFNMVSKYSVDASNLGEINNQLFSVFKINDDFRFDTSFLGSNLTQLPAKIFKENGVNYQLILPIFLLLGSALLQYFSAKIMMPAPKVDEMVVKKTTTDKEDDMMAAMRTQSLYMMPAMTVFLGWNFSLGMLLYWFTSSAVTIGQQVLINRINKK